jgi:hypothetical protein
MDLSQRLINARACALAKSVGKSLKVLAGQFSRLVRPIHPNKESKEMKNYSEILIADFRDEFVVNPEFRFSARKYLLSTLMNLWSVSDDFDSDLDQIRLIALNAGLRPSEIEKTIRHFDLKSAVL